MAVSFIIGLFLVAALATAFACGKLSFDDGDEGDTL